MLENAKVPFDAMAIISSILLFLGLLVVEVPFAGAFSFAGALFGALGSISTNFE